MRSIVRLTLLVSAVLCAQPALADWSTRSLGGTTVQLYTPSSAGAFPAGRGLMIGLHGCTQQATALKDRGNWEPAAERFGVVIALPQVPNGGVLAGCWDYYGTNHSRTNRHNGAVLSIVRGLIDDAALRIDPAQVYVSGLSSGGGQAMVLGCLAPDVFSGVGINAGPTVGTQSSEIARVATTKAQGLSACRTLAGSSSAEFATQQTSVIAGTGDYIVAQGYNTLNAEIMAELYSAARQENVDVSRLPGTMPQGNGKRWLDGQGVRVELILVTGMGHAFPAGSGTGAELSFIAAKGPAWPMVMLEQFTVGNRRASGRPSVDGGTVQPGQDAGVTPAGDAQPSGRDASGLVGRDATPSTSGSDATVGPSDGGVSDGGETVSTSGCRCVAGAGGSGWVGIALVAVGFVARRRRRR